MRVKQIGKRQLFMVWRSVTALCLLHALGAHGFQALSQNKQHHVSAAQHPSGSDTQQKTGASTPKTQDTTTKSTDQGEKSNQVTVQGADYVRCKFTLGELRALVAPDLAPTLSPADVEELQTKVVNAAAAQNTDPTMSGPALTELIEMLSSREFTNQLRGLTPSQALSLIIETVRKNRDDSSKQADIDWYKRIIVDALNGVNFPASAPMQAALAPQPGLANSPAQPDSKGLSATTPATSNLPSGKKSSRDAVTPLLQAVDDLVGGYNRGALLTKIEQLVVASQLTANEKTMVLAALNKSKPVDQQDLIDAARLYLNQLERPTDVGCSMSLLSWREVEYAFGYIIANEYIAVQVVVRNLNDKQQFVVQDVAFEVDADPTGRLGRFFSGRDKIVVRALANTQSADDPRNIVMNVVSGIGSLMNASAPIFGGSLTNASGVYNSAFVIGLGKGWKDLSSDQLKMIDDNSFSSAATSQMVVPKGGATVVFYTFIPSKQFQEGWWTQPCVERTYLGTLDKDGKLSGLSRGSYGQEASESNAVKDAPTIPPTGVDVERALRVCARDGDPLPHVHSKWGSFWRNDVLLKSKPDTQLLKVPSPTASAGTSEEIKDPEEKSPVCQAGTTTNDKASCKTNPAQPPATFDLFRNAYTVPYRKWSPDSLAIFRELANAVVTGSHILQDDQLQPDVSQLKCPVDDKGVVDFGKVEKDVLSCTLTGKNLDKYSKLRLRNAADAVDSSILDAPVTVTGDNTNATVNWPAAALHALDGANYLVYAIGQSGAEQKTSQSLHLNSGPYVVKVVNTASNTANFDGSKGASAQTLQVTGFHLDKVQTLTLTPEADSGETNSKRKAATLSLAKGVSPTDTTVNFMFDADKAAELGEGSATLSLGVTQTAGAKSTTAVPVDSSVKITVTAPEITKTGTQGTQGGGRKQTARHSKKAVATKPARTPSPTD